ncbi:uncharacterized protein BT62DRAFT_907367 [Guyanagaster necrorhizus]|uniref:DUF3533 domain-containing protein n=1 Tax=Guyanagaster necrorhizus TaxID=856835 RepID=A0A9P7VJP2_9AGAR|nr:uncharacterized protein BT62DRAFT_907367 [Guyanagaster necrorhizus MCA 3950]KAG7441803.1 hypothetical protein BT62DRAFT_907367 [Guyanagaster necrorhizus MCA 3950]
MSIHQSHSTSTVNLNGRTHTSAEKEKQPAAPPKPFSNEFTDKEIAAQRKEYIKALVIGCFSMVILLFGVFSIYWGALWKIPDHKLPGWVVDFDGSTIGSNVTSTLLADVASTSRVSWTQRPASDFSGPADVGDHVVDQRAWVAVVIHANATSSLNAAVSSPSSSYNGSTAVTVYVVEARNENAFRSLMRPYIMTTMDTFSQNFAQWFGTQLAASESSDTLVSILQTAPQIITEPVSYTIDNLRPFNLPVASAITFVGLIYLLVLCYFVVLIGGAARMTSGIEMKLTTKSLIKVRLYSTIALYFMISIFYSTLSRAFQADFNTKFGRAGFIIFWMLNFVGMLAVGLALEAMITFLTPKYMPFFIILWIISNVAVCFMPIEVLPHFYRYGYAFPFYNVSGAVRTILFGTKNQLGLHFGVLIAWTIISLFTLPLAQWNARRLMANAAAAAQAEEKGKN